MFKSLFSGFSQSVHHYAYECKAAEQRNISITNLVTFKIIKAPPDDPDDIVWLIPDFEYTSYEQDQLVVGQAHLFQEIYQKLQEMPKNQQTKALLTKVTLEYVHNPTPVHLDLKLTNRDDTDFQVDLRIPRLLKEKVPTDQHVRYVPPYADLGFNPVVFAGLESHVLKEYPDAITVFKKSDPLANFIHREKRTLGGEDADVVIQDDMCSVKKDILDTAQTLFKEHIYPMMRYTNGRNIFCEWTVPKQDQQVLYDLYREQLERHDPLSVPTISILLGCEFTIVVFGAKSLAFHKEKKLNV